MTPHWVDLWALALIAAALVCFALALIRGDWT